MWTGLLAVTLVRYIEALRMIFGPLPRYICWFQSLWRNCPTIGSLIFMDLIVIVRVRFLQYHQKVKINNLLFYLVFVCGQIQELYSH